MPLLDCLCGPNHLHICLPPKQLTPAMRRHLSLQLHSCRVTLHQIQLQSHQCPCRSNCCCCRPGAVKGEGKGGKDRKSPLGKHPISKATKPASLSKTAEEASDASDADSLGADSSQETVNEASRHAFVAVPLHQGVALSCLPNRCCAAVCLPLRRHRVCIHAQYMQPSNASTHAEFALQHHSPVSDQYLSCFPLYDAKVYSQRQNV